MGEGFGPYPAAVPTLLTTIGRPASLPPMGGRAAAHVAPPRRAIGSGGAVGPAARTRPPARRCAPRTRSGRQTRGGGAALRSGAPGTGQAERAGRERGTGGNGRPAGRPRRLEQSESQRHSGAGSIMPLQGLVMPPLLGVVMTVAPDRLRLLKQKNALQNLLRQAFFGSTGTFLSE